MSSVTGTQARGAGVDAPGTPSQPPPAACKVVWSPPGPLW